MPNFIAQLQTPKTSGLHDGLVAMYDAILADASVSDADKEIIARIRAQTDIALKGL